jgi:integrase
MGEIGQRNYVDFKVYDIFKIPERNNYGFRIALIYEDGSKRIKQRSGFATKKEADAERKRISAELYNGTYVVDEVKLKDVLNQWLEYDIRQRVRSRNTYDSYSSTIRNHIIPYFGENKLITDITKGDIYSLYKDRAKYSVSVTRQVRVVINTAMSYAVGKHLIAVNPAEGVDLPKTIEPKKYHTRVIETAKTLTAEQIMVLLEESKDTPIHMQVLFNVLMGLRRQEINGVKYSDVDYINRTLSVERQLGTGLNREPNAKNDKSLTKQELELKTDSSNRVLPIPDIVFEAILEERKIYEKNRNRRKKSFQDLDYICCSSYGRPRSKDFHWSHYKALLKKAGLPNIRWHDLRSTFCTLLLRNDFSPKAVSKLMGHAKEIITMDVYGDNANIIPSEIPEMLEYMEEVMPELPENNADEEILDGVGDIQSYLDFNEDG